MNIIIQLNYCEFNHFIFVENVRKMDVFGSLSCYFA